MISDPRVECIDCGRTKAPWGRSVPLEVYGAYCDFDCPGYVQDPRPSTYWPGERDQIFREQLEHFIGEENFDDL